MDADELTVTYDPTIFDVKSEEQARFIILTPECGLTTNQRWESETPYLVDLILSNFEINENSLVLDYGCGIGRISKELILKTGCRIVGVDISSGMRSFSATYVDNDKFLSCSPEMLRVLIYNSKLEFDYAISIWTLQHCYDPKEDIEHIEDSLALNGKLFIVNGINRIVPTKENGWTDDGLDINELIISSGLKKEKDLELSVLSIPAPLVQSSFSAVYKKI
jgi:SAM-dependent methyltransferase